MDTRIADGVTELRPHIYQLAGERPSCHSYLVCGEAKNVLIDPGLPAGYERLCAGLRRLGLAPADIDMVVLTHEHIDHVGAAPKFFDSAVIAAHSLAANKILLQDEFVLLNKMFEVTAEAFRVDLCFEGEATIELGNYRLRVLHTPGHCSGCICLYEPDHQLLFTGDTVMADGVMGGIFGSGNISDYIDSLKRLGTLRLAALYPGHGRVSSQPQDDIATATERAQTLLSDSKRLYEALNARHTYEHILRSARGLNR